MARVLVVEDDDDIRELVTTLIRAAGHIVMGVSNGDDAMRIVAQRGAPEVMVLDVGLPGMEGPEVLVAVRERLARPDLPAVFLSARVNHDDVERGRALGATYLTKPIDAAALIQAIRNEVPDLGRGW